MSTLKKQNKIRAVPNALLICNYCKKPCITLLKTWGKLLPSHSSDMVNSNSKNENIIKDQQITILVGENNIWVFQNIYNQYKEKAANAYSPYFPMCNICMNEFLTEIDEQTIFLKDQNKFLQQQFHRKDVERKMKQIIYKIRGTDLVIQQRHFWNPRKWKINDDRKEIEEYDKNNLLKEERVMFSEIGTRIFILFKTYSISYDKFYGTINDQRVGFSAQDIISIDEVGRGLNFMGQLVYNFSRIMQITNHKVFSQFKFYPFLAFKFNDVFVPISMKDRKEKIIQLFLSRFFELCNLLFEKIRTFIGDISPPYVINLELNTIGNINYLYDKNSPNLWSQAMKYLLFDLKLLMFYIIKNT